MEYILNTEHLIDFNKTYTFDNSKKYQNIVIE